MRVPRPKYRLVFRVKKRICGISRRVSRLEMRRIRSSDLADVEASAIRSDVEKGCRRDTFNGIDRHWMRPVIILARSYRDAEIHGFRHQRRRDRYKSPESKSWTKSRTGDGSHVTKSILRRDMAVNCVSRLVDLVPDEKPPRKSRPRWRSDRSLIIHYPPRTAREKIRGRFLPERRVRIKLDQVARHFVIEKIWTRFSGTPCSSFLEILAKSVSTIKNPEDRSCDIRPWCVQKPRTNFHRTIMASFDDVAGVPRTFQRLEQRTQEQDTNGARST